MVSNATAGLTCPSRMKPTSNGIFQGDDPLQFSLPLAIMQICLVVVVTWGQAFIQKPLRQPRVIAEIIILKISAQVLHSKISLLIFYVNLPKVSLALFFNYNTSLGPPYRVLVDTNFINFSIQNKLDLEKGMMDFLYAKSGLGEGNDGLPICKM
uniref:Uncharacterized protein n=1 Tax=Quercus lobata TaxID=97700 RepID=A0A7N2MEM0_QUELO